jgi:LDH2 family malate/lactate/ureidoglycolate dehydrogenase
MNIPPETFIRVPAAELGDFCRGLGCAAGLPGPRADLLAELLVGNDLRGVVSHGTRQIATYARLSLTVTVGSATSPRTRAPSR